jgi:hypothetical protein
MSHNGFTLRETADLINKSVDTVRRYYRAGQLPGAGPVPGDRSGTIYIPPAALVTAGLLSPDALADGEPEAVIARRAAERDRDAAHDELVSLRAEKAALQREVTRLAEEHERLHGHLKAALKARAA